MAPAMKASSSPSSPLFSQISLAAVIIITAACIAYANTFHVPFFFDDLSSIVDNPTIRYLSAFFVLPDDGSSSSAGRPLINFSFAINYAIGGLDVRGYHLVNLLIHIGAALTLLGLLRRTF